MKRLSKILCVFGLSCLFLMGCLTFTPNVSTIVLHSGETQTFTAESNLENAWVVWILDGQEVATANSYTFLAVNETSETITHELKALEMVDESTVQSSVVWSIIVQPTTNPQDVQATDFDPENAVNYEDRVIITWKEVPGASKYIIYRSDSPEGSYIKIGESYTTSYDDMQDENEKLEFDVRKKRAEYDTDELYLEGLNDWYNAQQDILSKFKATKYYKVASISSDGEESVMSDYDAGRIVFTIDEFFSTFEFLFRYPILYERAKTGFSPKTGGLYDSLDSPCPDNDNGGYVEFITEDLNGNDFLDWVCTTNFSNYTTGACSTENVMTMTGYFNSDDDNVNYGDGNFSGEIEITGGFSALCYPEAPMEGGSYTIGKCRVVYNGHEETTYELDILK